VNYVKKVENATFLFVNSLPRPVDRPSIPTTSLTHRLVIVSAKSGSGDGLARGLRWATTVEGRWGADEGAVGWLGRSGGLEDALWLGGGSGWDVGWALLEEAALWGAKGSCDTGDLDGGLAFGARSGVWVLVVAARWWGWARGWWWWGWGWRGWWGWAWSWAGSGNWERWLGGNTALTLGSDTSLELNVTVHTPGGTPRVLDDPVVGAVTDGKNTVVELGTAKGGEGSGLVGLEGTLVGFNCDGDWSSGDGSGEGILIGLLDVSEAGDGGCDGLLLLLVACLVLLNVWVVGFGVNALVVDNVLETVVHQTTLARVVTFLGGAIHKLLFGEGGKLAGGDLNSTLGGTGGGERPA